MVDRGTSETAGATASDWERQIRSQVSRIVEDIRATPPSVPPTSGSVSFEDVVGATARAVVPALLVDLPLELERLLGRVLEASGVPGPADRLPAEERVQLLRIIIARLSTEWAGLAERLVERLDAVLSGSRDPHAKARVHDRIAQQFRAGLLSTVVLGDAPRRGRDGAWPAASPLLPAEALAERMAECVARRIEELSGRLAESAAKRSGGKADGDRAEELRALLRAEIQETLGKMPPAGFQPEEIQTIASQIVHSLGASLTSMLFGPGMSEEEPRRRKGRSRKPKAGKKPSAPARNRRARPAPRPKAKAKVKTRRR
jgi:hypothetical protein